METQKSDELNDLFKQYNLELIELGITNGSSLNIRINDKNIVDLKIEELKKSYTSGFAEALK